MLLKFSIYVWLCSLAKMITWPSHDEEVMLRETREKLVMNHKTNCSISPVEYFFAVYPLMKMIIDWPG